MKEFETRLLIHSSFLLHTTATEFLLYLPKWKRLSSRTPLSETLGEIETI